MIHSKSRKEVKLKIPENTQHQRRQQWGNGGEKMTCHIIKNIYMKHTCVHIYIYIYIYTHPILLCQFISVQSLSRVQLCDPWIAAHKAFLSITNYRSLLKLMSIKTVKPPNHLILCPTFSFFLEAFTASESFPKSQFFASGGPKYWSFSFSINPSNDYSELISFMIDWFDFLARQGTLKSLPQHHSSKASVL